MRPEGTLDDESNYPELESISRIRHKKRCEIVIVMVEKEGRGGEERGG